MHEKPTGDRGPITLAGTKIRWEKIEQPKTKEALEQFYFDIFLIALKNTGIRNIQGKQNEENNFDFTLSINAENTYIDMAELVIAEGKGSPYKGQPPRYEFSRYTDAVRKVIEKKNAKYQARSSAPIQLLFYSTHWGFTIAPPIIDLMRYEIQSLPHRFNAIYYLQPLGENEGVLYMLYPAKRSISEKDYETMKANIAIPLDPKAWKTAKE